MSDYPRCKTCKWWTPDETIGAWGCCDRLTIFQYTTICALGEEPSDNYETTGYSITLINFGCVHHEEKT